MKCGRQDLKLSFIVIGICLLLVSTHYVNAKEEVEMAVRPFAIDPVTWHLLVDGIFDVSFDEHIIGVFLENKGKKTISNVTAAASFPSSSGIKIMEGICNFGDLIRNKPAFGFFRARFGESKPGKYPLILNVSGEVSGKPDSWETSRDLFVISSEIDPKVPNKWTVKFPEGKLIASVYEFNQGSNPGSSIAPKKCEWFVEYLEPFGNRYSDLPLGDPWLKVMASIAAVSGSFTALDERIKEKFGADCGETAKRLALEAFAGACIAVTPDKTDLIRMGQERIVAAPGEVTVKEKVEVYMEYLEEPVVGKPYKANVNWKYTRTTRVGDEFNDYTHPFEFKHKVRNTHFAGEPEVKSELRESGGKQEYVITARTRGPKLRNNEAYLVANLFEADDTMLKNVLQSIILRDDGHKGDRKAGDGIYTGIVSAESFSIGPPAGHGTYTDVVSASNFAAGPPPNVVVFLFDMNNTPESSDALSAAREIGGLLNSTSSIPLFPVKLKKGEKEKPPPKSENPVKELIGDVEYVSGIASKAAGVMTGIPLLLSRIKLGIDGVGSPALDHPVVIDENGDEIESSWERVYYFSGGPKLSLGFKILPFTVFGISGGYRSPIKWSFEINNIESTLSSHSIPLELYCRITFKGKFFLRLGVGADIYKATIVNSSFGTFTDSGIMDHISLGAGYFLNKRLALAFNVGFYDVGLFGTANLNNFTRTTSEDKKMLLTISDSVLLEEDITDDGPVSGIMPLGIDFSGLRLSLGIKLRIL